MPARAHPPSPSIAGPGFPANTNSVALVLGTLSMKNADDRGYARSLAMRISSWLSAAGIGHRIITDETVVRGGLSDAKVAILPLNPSPPPDELAALQAYVRHGGKLIVFFGTDKSVAELMNIRLGVYRANGKLNSFSFTRGAPPHIPPRIAQNSPVIFSALPASGDGAVIASWNSDDPRRPPEPAWIKTRNGFWMTHVLLDGDVENKKQMLRALIGDLAPETWTTMAAYWHARAGTRSAFERNLDDLVAQTPSASAKAAHTLAQQARTTFGAMQTAWQAASYPQSIAHGLLLQSIIANLYARGQAPARDHVRGIWVQNGTGLYPGNWPRTCREIADAGFNTIIPFVQSPGFAHYASAVSARSPTYHAYGDQLSACTAAAKAANVRVHAWKICWNMENAAPGIIQDLRRKGRLQKSDNGISLPWLCPSHPDNRALELDAICEIARNYDVQGIQLDFIRYRDSHHCFCDGCRLRFERATGRRVARWPADAHSGARAGEFKRWRAERISSFVREARQAVRQINPSIQLSAAVYGYYPRCIDSIGQDWGSWLAQGDIDFLCPMNYTTDMKLFTKWTRNELALPNAIGRIFPGIGVTATESRLDAVQTIDQIRAVRREGATGFTLFDLNDTLASDILPLLRLGVTSDAGK